MVLGNKPIEYNGFHVVALMCNWGGRNTMEFFPELMIPLSSKSLSNAIYIKVGRPPMNVSDVEFPIFYEIYATNMRPQKGKFLFKIYRAGRFSKKRVTLE